MIRQAATVLTGFLLKKELLDIQLKDMCQYRLERMLRTGLFIAVVLSIALPAHRFTETFCFLSSTYLCRRRMGGYHLSNPVACVMCSLGIVFLNLFLIGPYLQIISPVFLLIIALILDVFMFFISPKYPAQLKLSNEEVAENIRRKKYLSVFLAFIQTITFLGEEYTALLYILLGILFTVLSVVIYHINFKEDDNEKLEKHYEKGDCADC